MTKSKRNNNNNNNNNNDDNEIRSAQPLLTTTTTTTTTSSKGDKNLPSASSQGRQIRAMLWKQIRHELVPLGLGSAAMLVSSACNQALPRLMGRFIDQKPTRHSNTTMDDNALYWMVVIGGGLASCLRTMLLSRVEGSLAARLREGAVERLLVHKDLQWFQTATDGSAAEGNSSRTNTNKDDITKATTTTTEEEEVTPDATTMDASTRSIVPRTTESAALTPAAILNILQQDVTEIAQASTTVVANLLRSTSAISYSIYHMLILDAELLGVAAAVIPAVGVAAMALRKLVVRTTADERIQASRAASFVQERLQYLDVVHVANRQQDEATAYRELSGRHEHALQRQAKHKGLFMGFTFAAASSALLLVVHYGGRAVARGRLTPGQLTSFTTYSFLLGLGTSGVIQALSSGTKGWVSAKRYYQLVANNNDDEDGDNHDANEKKTTQDTNPPPSTTFVAKVTSISLEQVSFAYRSTGVLILKNISFTVPRGHVVALVGRNGSGKSTLAQILAGLYPPTHGRVSLSDGTALASIDPSTRPHLVQLVPQTSALFDLTILDNVRYAAPGATSEQVQAALEAANCKHLVETKGLDFVVGLHGHKLSGGERQRLSLARALVADPAVLILE